MRLPRFIRFFRYITPATLKQAFQQASRKRLTGLSAEMAYHAMLALFPAILSTIAAIGLLEDVFLSALQNLVNYLNLEGDSLQVTLYSLATQLKIFIPEMAWEVVSTFVKEIAQPKSKGLFSFSFVAAIWIASSVVSAAMNALDRLHRVPRHRRRSFWRAKLVSLLLTLGSVFLIAIASFLVLISDWVAQLTIQLFVTLPAVLKPIAAVEATATQSGIWGLEAPELLYLWRLLSGPIALGIAILTFAFIYRFGPSRRMRGIPIFPGAMLAGFAWVGLSSLFRLYVTNFGNYNKVYGTVGAFIVLMLWLYMSSLVMLLGAQLNVVVGEKMLKRDA